MRYPWRLWKAPRYSWKSRRLNSCVTFAHAQKRPKKALNSHFWLTFTL